jgi:hypothetical protein
MLLTRGPNLGAGVVRLGLVDARHIPRRWEPRVLVIGGLGAGVVQGAWTVGSTGRVWQRGWCQAP